jgi:hypothetical protein
VRRQALTRAEPPPGPCLGGRVTGARGALKGGGRRSGGTAGVAGGDRGSLGRGVATPRVACAGGAAGARIACAGGAAGARIACAGGAAGARIACVTRATWDGVLGIGGGVGGTGGAGVRGCGVRGKRAGPGPAARRPAAAVAQRAVGAAAVVLVGGAVVTAAAQHAARGRHGVSGETRPLPMPADLRVVSSPPGPGGHGVRHCACPPAGERRHYTVSRRNGPLITRGVGMDTLCKQLSACERLGRRDRAGQRFGAADAGSSGLTRRSPALAWGWA